MSTNGQRVTIATIAEAAGVSLPTVSRVLNGHAGVSPETRDRIEFLAREHGYRPRRTKSAARSDLVHLLFQDLDRPWAVELIRSIEEAARAAGVGTVVSVVHRDVASTRQRLQSLRDRASTGVILVVSDGGQPPVKLPRLKAPMVIIDQVGGSVADVPTIGVTNWWGGRAATKHLISLGHRRIGMVEGPKNLLSSRARLDGYRAALDEAGIRVDGSLIEPGDLDHESGVGAGERLLDRVNRPTAIFASDDQAALGVYEAARLRGVRVPQDLSVVGFGDQPEARCSAPRLTTVRQPLADMGALAVRMVLGLSRGEPTETPRVELATELVVRDSSAPLAG